MSATAIAPVSPWSTRIRVFVLALVAAVSLGLTTLIINSADGAGPVVASPLKPIVQARTRAGNLALIPTSPAAGLPNSTLDLLAPSGAAVALRQSLPSGPSATTAVPTTGATIDMPASTQAASSALPSASAATATSEPTKSTSPTPNPSPTTAPSKSPSPSPSPSPTKSACWAGGFSFLC